MRTWPQHTFLSWGNRIPDGGYVMAKQTHSATRRAFLLEAAVALPVMAAAEQGLAAAKEAKPKPAEQRPLKVVCVGAHPDDPESGCGGTLARYATAGHKVTVIYLTRGEAGIQGKSHKEAAAIRTAEAEKACKILGAR